VPGSKKNSSETVALRITVLDPPPNISWALQVGRDELVKPTSSNNARIQFDFTVDVVEDDAKGALRLRGLAVQGRPGGRFVYLCIGAYAGQVGAPAGWRAKVGLEGIRRKLVDAAKAKSSGKLEVQFLGTARDSGPARATVSLLGEGWRVPS
jgi:hypothetical protein